MARSPDSRYAGGPQGIDFTAHFKPPIVRLQDYLASRTRRFGAYMNCRSPSANLPELEWLFTIETPNLSTEKVYPRAESLGIALFLIAELTGFKIELYKALRLFDRLKARDTGRRQRIS